MEGGALRYRPELDAVRGIAVLLVLGGHLLVPGLGGGDAVGVTIFFVLSGYLITSVLQQNGDLVRFYKRRARRLLPALVFWLVALCAVGAVTVRETLPPLLYMANWAELRGGLAGPLGHTWSLATEEQFYLLWPLVLIAVRRPIGLLLLVIAVSAALRVLMPDNPVVVTASRFDALAWGCLLGLGVVPRIPRVVVVAAVAILVLLTVADVPESVFVQLGLTMAAAAAFVFMTVLLRRTTGPLAASPLMAVGRISYGLYLWHYPFALMVQRGVYTFDGNALIPTPGQSDDVVWIVAALAGTFGAAVVSWFAVERWFLQPNVGPRGGLDPVIAAAATP